MKWLVFLIAFLAMSCGGPHITVSSGFTDGDRIAMELAAQKWNGISHRTIDLSGGSWAIVREPTPNGYYGWTQGSPTRRISISPTVPSQDMYLAVLHEFGHSIGLSHVCHGVMWGTNPPPKGVCTDGHPTVDFTPEDIAECVRVGACK